MPPQLPQSEPVSRRLLFLLGALVGLVLGVGAASLYVFLESPEAIQLPSMQESQNQVPQIRTGWKLYQHLGVGIAFEYPEAWGEISTYEEKGECYIEGTPGAQKMLQSGDPCLHIAFSAGSGVSSFLAVQTSLYDQYGVGRGGYWGDTQKRGEVLATLCVDKPSSQCQRFTNSHGVTIVRNFELPSEMGDNTESAWIYRVVSSHPYFTGIMFSAFRLGEDKQADFPAVIDSVRFL